VGGGVASVASVVPIDALGESRASPRRNHLGGNIRGSTFRLTLASILGRRLGLERERRSLSGEGEPRLTSWMERHLRVAVVPVPDREKLLLLEHQVLAILDPPLNVLGMRPTSVRATLSGLRRSEDGPIERAPARQAGRRARIVPDRAEMNSGVPDITAFLSSLVGRTIPTLTGRPNTILGVSGGFVRVATGRSPEGQPVDIEPIQQAATELYSRGELMVDVRTVGYRSAFVGAVLSALPGTRAESNPRRILLVDAPLAHGREGQ
jgi:hypothetical protein